jgi:hypothetical protein
VPSGACQNVSAPGESWKAIEEGRLERDGDMPVNRSGGLIGGGHPVGATGTRMLVDATKQVSGTAGDYQVDGAERVATLKIGGSTAATACFMVQSAPTVCPPRKTDRSRYDTRPWRQSPMCGAGLGKQKQLP